MKAVVLLSLLLGVVVATAESAAYQSRGWRPRGPAFNPAASGQQLQRIVRPAQRYGPPVQETPTTPRIPTTTTEASTTTERSREPTTPSTPTVQVTGAGSSTDEDIESNPALAVANSFAFNRPIYVYNAGFPFHPAYMLLQ